MQVCSRTSVLKVLSPTPSVALSFKEWLFSPTRQRALRSYTRGPGRHKLKCESTPTSAYVHLPFCKRRCYYCDFPIRAVGQDPGQPAVQNTMREYVDLLCKEIEATKQLGHRQLQTVFFGGGTPSLVPPAMLRDILLTLQNKFGLSDQAEVSMEADPGTFDAQLLQEFASLGVSRFSVGIQAFSQEVLEKCGRSHGLADVHKAIQDIKAAGVMNWSLDLISGLPYTSLNSWQQSLEQALASDPQHISIYDLQVEEKTKFGSWYSPGQFPLPSDDAAARMYCTASEVLRAGGYEHYEISSFAKPGYRCRHNSTYWSGAPYYAFGLGAASYLDGRRFCRPTSMSAYKSWANALHDQQGGIPGGEEGPEALDDQLLDMIMLRMRLSDGLDFRILAEQFGSGAASVTEAALAPHVRAGLAEQLDDGSIIRLKDPDGFLVSNHIISDIFAALDAAPVSVKLAQASS